MENIRNKIKQVIINTLNKDMNEDDLVGENLINELGITSVDSLEILIAIEGEFNIQISDADLNQELIASIDNLEQYILNQMGDKKSLSTNLM